MGLGEGFDRDAEEAAEVAKRSLQRAL